MNPLDYLVAAMLCIGFSMFCALLNGREGFSMQIFLGSMAISIGVMCWIPVFPQFMIFVSVLMLGAMLFMNEGETI